MLHASSLREATSNQTCEDSNAAPEFHPRPYHRSLARVVIWIVMLETISIWVFPKTWVPQNGWFIMENPINPWMVWGYHHFRKHPYINQNIQNGMLYNPFDAVMLCDAQMDTFFLAHDLYIVTPCFPKRSVNNSGNLRYSVANNRHQMKKKKRNNQQKV